MSDTSILVPLPPRPSLPDSLADVLNATGIGTLVLDNGLNIRWFTPAIQSLYRCRTGDVGRPLVEMQPLSDDPHLLQEAELVLGGLDFSEREVEGQSKRWFKRRIQPCLTTDGLMDGVVMTFVDITDQRQIYAALAAAENRAQLATVAKSRFLAVASHDLRQPLQTMVILQGLLAGCVSGTKAKDLVGRMAETLGSMSRMLDVLLDINQIEAGVVEPNLSTFPVMSLLQDLFDEFSTTATSRGVDMRVVRSSLFVRSDPVLLEQMLRNLVSNALKYAPGKRVLIGCRRSGAELLIEVRDSGIGIPSAEMGAIFDEYFQIRADAPGLGQGMGLGLNIVQRLGAILGHPVSAWSALGKGSSFTVRVPCVAGPVEKAVSVLASVAESQERELREATAGSGLTVTRDGQTLIVALPEAITFATGSAVVRANLVASIAAVSRNLQMHRNSTVLVEGHTDNVGSYAVNQDLSERRALAVARILINNGTQSQRVSAIGRAYSAPVATNSTAAGRAQNRRVAIIITPNG